jgi:hypothetical protein
MGGMISAIDISLSGNLWINRPNPYITIDSRTGQIGTLGAGGTDAKRFSFEGGASNVGFQISVPTDLNYDGITILDVDKKPVISIYAGQVIPDLSLYATPGTSYYTIIALSDGGARWNFYDNINMLVQCAIFVKPVSGGLYSLNADPSYVSASGDNTPLTLSRDLVPTGATIGLLVPGSFVLYNNSNIKLVASFNIISGTSSGSTAADIGYQFLNSSGQVTNTQNLSPNSIANLSIYTVVARFYLIKRGAYIVKYADPGQQLQAERNARDADFARDTAKAQVVLSLVSQGLTIVQQTVSIVGDIAKIGAGA